MRVIYKKKMYFFLILMSCVCRGSTH